MWYASLLLTATAKMAMYRRRMITDAHHDSDDEHDVHGDVCQKTTYDHDLDNDDEEVDDDRRRDVKSMPPDGV
jgi:hypothetical protein